MDLFKGSIPQDDQIMNLPLDTDRTRVLTEPRRCQVTGIEAIRTYPVKTEYAPISGETVILRPITFWKCRHSGCQVCF